MGKIAAFHSYDIRGVYGEDFNQKDVYKIGFFLPELLKVDKILVGRDVRVSSDEIFELLVSGITDAGADVYDAGLATTPMIYFLTAKEGFDGSVMITASHNPREHNGMKISKTNALPVGYDTGLNKLEKMVLTDRVEPVEKKGKIIPFDRHQSYEDFLKSYLPDMENLKVAVDCSNGMAGLFVRNLLGDKPVYINEELDGTFPNHDPNPLNPANIVQLQEKVKETGADLGIIYDGDADRVMFTDEKGQFISPDLMIALMGHYFLEKNPKTKILQDIRTSKSVKEYLAQWSNVEVAMWKVGRAHAAPKLREIDGLYGGELAGHYYFRDFFYSDSGILASLIILDVVGKMKKQGKPVSELMGDITGYANSGEINFKISQKKEAMEALKSYFTAKEKPLAIYDFDGYRIEFADWWFNIRPS
ncbi:MAG: phosphomannomutase/phosphoglucomutase, partial [Bacteroidales bacterium]|nr:phosphomannomutase/phosphoglucomutase [Bacteroidales bacterium]